MRIESARIKGYRTIKDEMEVHVADGVTLVGPNNVGKTNILKGIRHFFTGYDNIYGYDRSRDLSLNQYKTKTNIAVAFSGDPNGADQEIYDTLDNIRSLLGITGNRPDNFTVYLTFSEKSNPNYRVFPNVKRPTAKTANTQYSRLERKLIDYIIDKFSVHYIPSDKSTTQLYQELVLPFLLKKSYKAIYPHLGYIRKAMQETAETLNQSLTLAGLGHLNCTFEFPEKPERLLGNVEFRISDPNETSIFSKGMGIQSAALIAAFNWITSEEVAHGKSVLWLLEEPEAYLHPQLVQQYDSLIGELRKKSQVVATTHSLGFVPQDPNRILGIELEDDWSQAKKFKTYHEATARIRRALGVRFSDFYNLSNFNVLVEGETDREYMNFFKKLICDRPSLSKEYPILSSKNVSFLDHGGVKGIEGFLRATYEFIGKERPALVVLDGDDAGDKCRRDLQGFFGGKQIPFQPNQHFIIVKDRFAIEGLFPDEWIKEAYASHPNWFKNFSVDASDELQPFAVKDENKRSFLDWVTSKADLEADLRWAKRWLAVFSTMEGCLRRQGGRIYGTDCIETFIGSAASEAETVAARPDQTGSSIPEELPPSDEVSDTVGYEMLVAVAEAVGKDSEDIGGTEDELDEL
jgi:AAA15 family ATPase/GTPase